MLSMTEEANVVTLPTEHNMDNIAVKFRLPTAGEFLTLRRSAGWQIPDTEAVAAALKNTLFAVCVEKDGRIIGSGRVVGDGALCFYVQDVIVLPECQRKGVGTKIMDALMDYIHKTAKPTAYIGLFSALGLQPFYRRYGFIERPQGNLGPGMVFLKK